MHRSTTVQYTNRRTDRQTDKQTEPYNFYSHNM